MPPRLNIPQLVRNWEQVMTRLPAYPDGAAAGSLVVQSERYEKGEIARFYDPAAGRFQYDKWPNPVSYTKLVECLEEGEAAFAWMTTEQSEVSSMDAHAKAACGEALLAGLGLGVMPWLTAKNPNVRSITVVETRPELVELIAPVVANKKTTFLVGDVWEHLASHPGTYDFIDLDIWPDAAEAVLESAETYQACTPALKPGGIVRTWLDELSLRLTVGGTLHRICRKMAADRGGRFINPTINYSAPCEFCGIREYLDCYDLCVECCVNLGLPLTLGGVVQERFGEMMENINAAVLAAQREAAGGAAPAPQD